MKYLITFLILFSQLVSASSNFDINVEFDTFRVLRFSNFELLDSYYKKDIDFKQLSKELENDFEQGIKLLFKCSSLTDEEIVDACLKKLESSDLDNFGYSLPYFVFQKDERLGFLYNKLSNQLKSFEDKLNIHQKLRDKLGNTFGYFLAENVFYTDENATILDNNVAQFKIYPKGKLRLNGICNVKVTGDHIALSESDSYTETESFDREKCKSYMQTLGILTQNIDTVNMVDFPNVFFPFPPYNPKYKKIIDKHLDIETAKTFYSRLLVHVYKHNSVVNLAIEKFASYFRNYVKDMASTQFDYSEGIDYLVNTKPEGFVEYDGVLGVHNYIDRSFAQASSELFLNMINNPDVFRKHVIQENLATSFVDTNTESESSRLEIIDLTSNLFYREMHNSFFMFKVGANSKNYFKGIIDYLSGNVESVKNPIYIAPRGDKDESPNILCAFPSKETENGWFSPIKFVMNLAPRVQGMQPPSDDGSEAPEPTETSYTCSDKEYLLRSEERLNEAVKVPEDLVIDDGYVDILMPYSLTGELTDNFKKLATTYFKALRYKVVEEKLEDVKHYVSKQIQNIDVLMPAGHGLASRDLSLGTKKATLITFTREKLRGQKYGVRFKFILPIKTDERETINIHELADSYVLRMKKTQNPLFVFVISCSSENNLGEWSLIYRKAMEQFGGDNGMLPHVIASSRGFPTSSTVDIASSVFYPSDVADLLAKGSDPKSVFEVFKTRKYGSIASELTKRIGLAWLPLKNASNEKNSIWRDIFKKPESDSFSPVYNLSNDYRERILKMSGTRYTLAHEGLVIFDETY